MKTTELEYGTLEVTVENRSQDKKITFLAKGMEDAKQKAAEWQVGQNLKRKCQMDWECFEMQERKYYESTGEETDRNRCKMQKLQSVGHTLIDNRGI